VRRVAPLISLPALSLDLDPVSGDTPRDFRYEVPGGIVEIQLERTRLLSTVVTEMNRLTQVDRPHKVSVAIVVPNAVSELETAARNRHPRAQADVARPRVDVGVVYLCSAEIPVLESFLDGLAAHPKLDVPQPDDRRVVSAIC